ncbi:major facilitator superfamily domain-containing protein [Globomyces pollinis-pini]|nr:major facilitator superfamily domain-containing protein [Globomyces pollinis-pini]
MADQETVNEKPSGFKLSKVMWVLFAGFVLSSWFRAIEGGMVGTLSVNIYADFNSVELVSIATLTSTIVGVFYPLIARLTDVFGRKALLVVSIVLGYMAYFFIIISTSGGVFQLGQSLSVIQGAIFGLVLSILIADYVPLKFRVTFYSILTFPGLVWGFISIGAVEYISYWKHIYIYTIPPITITYLMILYGVFKTETVVTESKETDEDKSGVSHAQKFNIVGNLMLCASITLVFIPVNVFVDYDILSVQVLLPTVLGFLLLIGFFLYEIHYAIYPLFPKRMLLNRTVMGGLLVNVAIYGASNICFGNFQQLFQVTRGSTPSEAAYLQYGYGASFSLISLPVGLLLQYLGRYKRFVTFGYVLYLAGFFLFLNTRGNNSTSSIEIIVVQCVVGLGSGIAIAPILSAMQGASDHEDVAMVTSLDSFSVFVFGYGFDLVSNAFWNRLLPHIIRTTPGGEDIDTLALVKDFQIILELPEEQANLVKDAYMTTQRTCTFVGIGLLLLGLVPIYFMEDYDFRDRSEKEETDILVSV